MKPLLPEIDPVDPPLDELAPLPLPLNELAPPPLPELDEHAETAKINDDQRKGRMKNRDSRINLPLVPNVGTTQFRKRLRWIGGRKIGWSS